MELLDMLPLPAPVLQRGRDTGLDRHIHLSRPTHLVPTTCAVTQSICPAPPGYKRCPRLFLLHFGVGAGDDGGWCAARDAADVPIVRWSDERGARQAQT